MISQKQNQYCQTASLAGELLIQSNAEAYRVEETVTHILNKSDLTDINVIALTTGLYISVSDEESLPVTYIKRIKNRSINLYRISQVNEISRLIESNQLSIEEAYQQLIELKESEYDLVLKSISIVVFITLIFILFGGSLSEWLVVIPIAIVVSGLIMLLDSWKLNVFIRDFIISISISILTTIASQFMNFQIDLLTISAIMPLVPGTALTNGVRDLFRGDYTSGLAKLLEAFMIAVFIALGIASGLLLLGGFNG